MWSNLQDQSSQNGRSIVVSCKPIPMPIARNKISNICMLAMNVGNRSKFDLKWWVQNVGFEIDFTCWMWIWLRMLGVHLNICWMQILIKNIVWFSKFKILNSWASIGFCWIFQVYPYSCIGEFDWEGGGGGKNFEVHLNITYAGDPHCHLISFLLIHHILGSRCPIAP